MKAWDVPGAAVGVVAGDQIVHAAGYGLREVRRGWPVTDRTLFAVGSCTKSFTATAAAILVDQGLLDWDRPVREYMPSFRLADPIATRQATPRDLLSHQVGLAPHNELNPFDTRAQRLARLRHLAFAQPFRRGYLYNNKMYLAAGALIERLSGMPYEQFVRQRILQPLGMTATCFAGDLPVRPERAPAGLDLAVGYLPGQPRRPWFQGWTRSLALADMFRSNGADQTMHSNISDMCHWLRMQASGGRADACHLLSARRVRELRTPQVCAAAVPWLTGGDLASTHYAMGWVTQTWRERPRIFHGGTAAGCMSRVSFLPDDGVGVVVICNTYAGGFIEAVTLGIFDRLLGLDPVRWTARLRQEIRRRRSAAGKAKPKAAAAPPPPGPARETIGGLRGHLPSSRLRTNLDIAGGAPLENDLRPGHLPPAPPDSGRLRCPRGPPRRAGPAGGLPGRTRRPDRLGFHRLRTPRAPDHVPAGSHCNKEEMI